MLNFPAGEPSIEWILLQKLEGVESKLDEVIEQTHIERQKMYEKIYENAERLTRTEEAASRHEKILWIATGAAVVAFLGLLAETVLLVQTQL